LKKKQEVDDEIRKRLHRFGYQDNQIDVIIDEKKAPKAVVGSSKRVIVGSSSRALIPHVHNGPTYIKIHKNHVDIETLKYFNLPYAIDEGDSDYFVIFEELDKEETQMIFEHTRKLRKRTKELLIENRGRGRDPQLAFVRRRTPSASPSRIRSKSVDKRVIRLW